MSKPRLVEIAQMAEVVAAIAVVVSLVYVGREVQANTNAIRGASLQALTSVQADLTMGIATDSATARIRQVGGRDPSDLIDAERFRFFFLMRQTWLNFQNAYLQNELGLLDQRFWADYDRSICRIWSAQGVREAWAEQASLLDPGFVALVEACSTG